MGQFEPISSSLDGGNLCNVWGYRKNVGYASTCNVVGQTVGIFFGNVVYLTLQSKEFANKWLRSTPADTGIVDLDGECCLSSSIYQRRRGEKGE